MEEGSFVSQMAPPPVREVVVSLAMIRNLMFSYANGAVLPSDIFAIEEALCYILVHTQRIKNQEEDEEEEEVPVDEALSPEEEERRLEMLPAREEDVNDKIAIFTITRSTFPAFEGSRQTDIECWPATCRVD